MNQDRLKEVFFRALELPESARTEFIARECASEPDLLEQVTDLVRHHDDADGFLVPARAADPEPTPATIGGRRILRRLGRGGFGLVYLAEQDEPVRMRVAIKVVRPGMASDEVLARFAAERRALERMKHPNIAAVLDAGTTPEGSPYFVLEYVEGEIITRFADRHRLDVAARCRLLIDVCRAVQHAHEKGVLHRDIKPGNVLVTEIDGRPVPKVIDFGLAKAIRGTLSDSSALTLAAQIVGTPQYMSPEQVSHGEIDIDTRTDVYSLGALAYELLAGAPCFSVEQVRNASPGELERLIRDEIPARPSSRVLQAEPPTPERLRRARQLRGDLDWIVARAMAKEPERRYHSAEALAADLARQLAGEPVEAGPPSRLYRLRKLFARHRVEFVSALVVVLALIATTLVSIDAARRARIGEERAEEAAALARAEQERTARELQKFEEVAAFSESMLVGIDPRVARGADSALMRRMLDQAAAKLESAPPAEPEVEVHLRRIVGLAYHAIAENEEAARQLRRAFELASARLPATDGRRLEASAAWAQVLAGGGRPAEGLLLFQEIAAAREAIGGPDDPETLAARSNVAVVLGMLGRHREAHDLHEDVVARRERVLGAEHADTMASRNNLATQKDELGRSDEAAAIFERVLAYQLRTLGRTHPQTLATMNNLALSCQQAGRIDEAARTLEEVLEIKRSILPPTHPSILIGMNNLASLHGEHGRPEEAVRILDEAIGLAEPEGGPGDRTGAVLRNNRGSNLARLGRHEEALADFQSAGAALEGILGRGAAEALGCRLQECEALLELGRAEEALAIVGAQDDLAAEVEGSRRLRVPAARIAGRALLALGRVAEARSSFERGHALVRELQAGHPDRIRAYLEAVAEVLEAAGRVDEAAAWRAR